MLNKEEVEGVWGKLIDAETHTCYFGETAPLMAYTILVRYWEWTKKTTKRPRIFLMSS